MTDIQYPLAIAGRAYVWGDLEHSLGETHPAQEVELVRHQYVALLFSPMWGVIFETYDDN